MVRNDLAIILSSIRRVIANRNGLASCYHLSFLDNLENGYLLKKGSSIRKLIKKIILEEDK